MAVLCILLTGCDQDIEFALTVTDITAKNLCIKNHIPTEQ